MTTLLSRRSVLIGWLLFALGLLMLTATLTLKILNASGSAIETLTDQLIFQLIEFLFICIGAITIARRPENRVSWLLGWIGVFMLLSELSDQYAMFAYVEDGPLLPTLSAWVASWAWAVAFGPIATLLVLWFPTGRVVSPKWIWVEKVAFAILGLTAIILAFADDPEATSSYDNPFATRWMTDLGEAVIVVMTPLFPSLVLAALISLVIRFRRSRGEERQQLKWFVAAAAPLGAYMALDTLLVALPTFLYSLFEAAAFLGVPVAVAVAILKYRLYDIDLIVNRALVYGALTASLALVYLILVLGLQFLLNPITKDSDVAVAASTLTVAALFRPFRSKVQGFIDRRFYRRRYDAQQTLGEFGSRLRDRVDLDVVIGDVIEVADRTMRPTHVSMWVKKVGS